MRTRDLTIAISIVWTSFGGPIAPQVSHTQALPDSLGMQALPDSLRDLMGTRKPAEPPKPTGPPCSSPEYRQFDFWLGEWDVKSSDGKVLGQNRITRIFNGCVLQENWTGAAGSQGTSFNMYDAASSLWHQTWVDDKGSLLVLFGKLMDGKMVLQGKRPSELRKGGITVHRITWSPTGPDRLKQTWETSEDGGQKWSPHFEGLYSRRK